MARSKTYLGPWIAIALCAPGFAADGFVKDSIGGCSVFRPSLLEGEMVSWKGRCAQGYAAGAGTATWSLRGKTTLVYEGTFVRGKLEGIGRMRASGGDHYDGEYKGGKRDGKGIYQYANGERYEGGYKDNLRDGSGTVVAANGARMVGEWRAGSLVGTASASPRIAAVTSPAPSVAVPNALPAREKSIEHDDAPNHEVPSWVHRAAEEAGLFGWMAFWGFLLLTPVYFLANGVSQLRARAKEAAAMRPSVRESAARSLLIGLVLLAGALLILLLFGRLLIALTIKGVGEWAVGFVWAVVICLVAFPLCLVGAQLRLCRDYRKAGYPARSAARKAATRAALGIGAMVVVGAGLLAIGPRFAWGFSIVALIAGIVGWFGGILVPEDVGELLE